MIHVKRFEGRVALVTGGASGIGRAVVDRLVSEGAKVAIWDVNQTGLDDCQKVHGATFVRCEKVDVTDEAAVSSGIKTIGSHFGKLDILVNGAGIIGPNGPFWETTPEQWERVMRVNVTSMFLVSRAAKTLLTANGWGRVVNIASVTANEGPQNLSAYAASKAAIVGLTKSMGKDLATSGVLVNAIAPALIATEIVKQLSAEYYSAALSKIPMGRAGTLEEASALVCWLCSEECSFSTGAVYDLSGGRGLS